MLFSCTLTPHSSSRQQNRSYPDHPLIERTFDEYLRLDEEELLDYAAFADKSPSSFYGLSDLPSYKFMPSPASSEQEASEWVKRMHPVPYEINLIKEEALYWVHEILYDVDREGCNGYCRYFSTCLTMKQEACDYAYPSITIHKPEMARAILDIYSYSLNGQVPSHKFLASKLDEESSTYSNLQIHVVHGDWHMKDEVSLLKTTWTLSEGKSKATISEVSSILTAYGEVDLYEYPA